MPSVTTKLLAVAAAVAVAVGILMWWITPTPPTLGAAQTGDAALAAQVRELAAERGYRGLSVAVVDQGRVRFAGIGESGNASAPQVTEATAFEVGSIGKPLTGMLLEDLGISGDTTLADIYPQIRFDDPDTGAITLAELASHRSGLPRLPATPLLETLGSWLAAMRYSDPYAGMTRETILNSVAGVSTEPGPQEHSYSNFGFAVLGHALADSRNTGYDELLRSRILDPLGLNDTGFHREAAPPDAAVGGTARGPSAGRWTASGLAPAGSGLWSTSPDLARLLTALMSGQAPGQEATTPRYEAGPQRRIGYGWITERFGDREVVWHNGGTGGFRSFAAYDPQAGRGVVVLGNTDRDVDGIGLRLLGFPAGADTTEAPRTGTLAIAITLMLLAFALLSAASSARQALRPGPRSDRLQLAGSLATAVALLAIAHQHGDWLDLPPVLWTVVAGLVAGCATIALWHWRRLPTTAANQKVWLRWLSAAVSVGLAAAFVTLMAA